jgi:uncharacterized phage protein (TIGR01671 family)
MNQRQIKFRAWDVEHKVITPVANISFGDDGSAETSVFETAPKQKHYRGLVDGENGILMRFTGLKDKNGKEIYEGDIVKRSFGRVHDIVWHEFTASFRIGRYAITEMVFQKMEVVGNIYENPDLLK